MKYAIENCLNKIKMAITRIWDIRYSEALD